MRFFNKTNLYSKYNVLIYSNQWGLRSLSLGAPQDYSVNTDTNCWSNERQTILFWELLLMMPILIQFSC